MQFRVAELEKLTTNLVQFGEVVEVEYNKVKVKVDSFEDDFITDWLPCLTQISENATNYARSKIGAIAVVLSPLGDLGQAFVLGFLEKQENKTKFETNKEVKDFGGGVKFEFDAKGKELNITGVSNIKLNGSNLDLTGKINTGNINAGDIKGSKIHTNKADLETHTHTTTGTIDGKGCSGNTAPPTPLLVVDKD